MGAKELLAHSLSLLPGFLILLRAHSLNLVFSLLHFSVSFHSLDYFNHPRDFRYHLYADNSLKYVSSFRYTNMPGAAPVIKHINIFVVKYGKKWKPAYKFQSVFAAKLTKLVVTPLWKIFFSFSKVLWILELQRKLWACMKRSGLC